MYACTSVRRLLAVGQNLPGLRLLIITIKHNDYIFSSFRYASVSVRGRVQAGQCKVNERDSMPCNCCSAQSRS